MHEKYSHSMQTVPHMKKIKIYMTISQVIFTYSCYVE